LQLFWLTSAHHCKHVRTELPFSPGRLSLTDKLPDSTSLNKKNFSWFSLRLTQVWSPSPTDLRNTPNTLRRCRHN